MNAQDLKQHKWENRLIVIASPTFENRNAVIQKAYLKAHFDSLQDRKLIVYHVTNTGYTVNFEEEIHPSLQNNEQITRFSSVLIGLDGTIKYKAGAPQPSAQYFTLIDKMPMRLEETGG